jgi:hypothetical protein
MKTILLFVLLMPISTWAFPITQIQNSLMQLKQAGQTPIAVFDLDETLIHSAKRKAMSFIKAIERNQALLNSQWPTETKMAYEKLTYSGDSLIRGLSNQYDTAALFRKMGIRTASFVQKIDALALPIYLSNEFIYLDSALVGAVQLLNTVYRLQGKIYFVTARFKSTQYEETLRNLKTLGFLQGSQQSFVVLRNDNEGSLDFKKRVFAQINASRGQNQVVALVGENEPENMNAMLVQFPNAIPVFVEGAIMNQNVQIPASPRVIFTKNFIQD